MSVIACPFYVYVFIRPFDLIVAYEFFIPKKWHYKKQPKGGRERDKGRQTFYVI